MDKKQLQALLSPAARKDLSAMIEAKRATLSAKTEERVLMEKQKQWAVRGRKFQGLKRGQFPLRSMVHY